MAIFEMHHIKKYSNKFHQYGCYNFKLACAEFYFYWTALTQNLKFLTLTWLKMITPCYKPLIF